MNYQIREIENNIYIELISATEPLRTEKDALDLVALCGEHDTDFLLIHHSALSPDFFRLETKVAGDIIQKLTNYGIKAAALMPQETFQKGRFGEMSMEANKGNHFRMYESKEEAEKWFER